ncbi:MAG: FtsX-like permease family protein [Candidatus Heimdallarchaeota archaeon]|nr:FtsX-like permease family protein [Candidatus Heimdallarchaeota archaeon]
MSKLKLLTKSIVFSTRSRRRFFTFVIVFSILSGATIILLSYFDNFSRQGLLTHKGVVIEASEFGTAGALLLSEATNGIGTIPAAEKVIYYKYINFGSSLRIISMDPQYPWAFTDLKPNNLISGHFPHHDDQVLISDEALLALEDSEGLTNLYTKPVVGTSFTIGRTVDSTFKLTVSGIFKKPQIIEADTNWEWIFVTEDAFDIFVDEQNLNLNADRIFVHSISIIAGGDVFSGAAYDNVDDIASSLIGLDSANFRNPDFTPKTDKDENRNMMFLSLMFGIFGTFMVSTLYSYLITRFRRREVAVLKAMGYSKWSVRTVVLSEILVVAVTGFVIGLIAIQAFLYFTSSSSYVFNIILSPTAVLSFLAVVLSSIPGFLLITTRILGVRPIEIFRQK